MRREEVIDLINDSFDRLGKHQFIATAMCLGGEALTLVGLNTLSNDQIMSGGLETLAGATTLVIGGIAVFLENPPPRRQR